MEDPYISPLSSSSIPVGTSSRLTGEVSEQVIETLYRTRGWVRFISVLGLIFCALLVIAGITMIVRTSGDEMMETLGLITGVSYFLSAVFYLYPCIRLYQFSSIIGLLRENRHESNLVAALEAQRSFWKYLGVMTLLLFCLAILAAASVIGISLMPNE